jgi:hypothetical protein
MASSKYVTNLPVKETLRQESRNSLDNGHLKASNLRLGHPMTNDSLLKAETLWGQAMCHTAHRYQGN